MRKTMAVVVLTAALTVGPAAIALADEAVAAPVILAQAEGGAGEESDKTGLWGLLGLLGLAGLIKRKEHDDVDAGRRR